jgi:class 3 adenylate cyclase
LSEEERKLVTILFADVIGSTQLGEKLDPERLRSLFSAYFSAMSAVIEAWGGTVEKFIGDAIMAAFGIPIVREDDAERALRASLEMLERLDDLNRDFRERHRVTLEIRIGVNTGEVIAPVGGPPDQMIVAGTP